MTSKPIRTPEGVTCGRCSKWDTAVKHGDVQTVRECYAQAQRDEDEARAEYEAEWAAERFWEDPYGRGAIEAQAQRAYEDSLGVIQWEDARDAAERGYYEAANGAVLTIAEAYDLDAKDEYR